jgi:hypothetical protein
MGKAANILPQRGVKIMLDKPRVVRFNMRALAWLSEKHGSVSGAMEVLNNIGATMTLSSKELYALADLVCAGLLWDDPDMTTEYVCDNFDLDEIILAMPFIVEAFMQTMPKAQEVIADPPKA